MPGAVLDKLNERFRFAYDAEQFFYDLKVGFLMATADVIHLSGVAALERRQDRTGMLVGEDPLSHIHAVAIDRQGTVLHGILDQHWNEFFGKLIWPVVVGTARNQHWNPVGLVIGKNEK